MVQSAMMADMELPLLCISVVGSQDCRFRTGPIISGKDYPIGLLCKARG